MENSLDTSVPDYSVVVPVRNEAQNIPPLIAELKTVMTAYRPYEIVIVDDASNDGTRGLYPRIRGRFPDESLVIKLQDNNQGKGAALGEGVALSTGDVILSKDPDL